MEPERGLRPALVISAILTAGILSGYFRVFRTCASVQRLARASATLQQAAAILPSQVG